MTVSSESVQQINQLLDRIVQVKDSPESIQQAVENVKAKITQLVQDAQSGKQAPPTGQHPDPKQGQQHQPQGLQGQQGHQGQQDPKQNPQHK